MYKLLRNHRPINPSQNQCSRLLSTTQSCFGQAPPTLLALPALTSESHHILAKTWLDNFEIHDIPTKSYEITYSRSSGPGGQHVNKTNSKATLRCNLTNSRGWLPPFVIAPLTNSPNYLSNPPTIQISCQVSRSSSQNVLSAVSNFHRIVVDAGRSVLVGVTSQEQRDRVKGLMRAEEARRREGKEKRKGKKEGRRGGWE